jgi:phosphoribosylamine--glycine ligase
MKKILIVGSGGREHALGWKLSQNDEISTVFYAPGNGGTAENKGININIDGTKKENFEEIYRFIIDEKIDMVIVGPEGPLVDGIVDYLNEKGYNRVFGPSRKASLLESDKFFSFDLMNKLNIPQAESIKCRTMGDTKIAIDLYCGQKGIVIKSRGLTGGKGVRVCDSKNDAVKDIESHLTAYGDEVLIAERLFGREFSVFGISDGTKVFPFEVSFQDHKRLMDNDKGPNTGGMGAYGPVPFVTKEIIMDICKGILTPIIQELREMGIIYKGFLYAGMIMTEKGPKVLEFNVRFGDPECQPAMMMLKSDLYSLLSSAIDERLEDNIQFSGAACCVVLASKGYPGYYKKYLPILGLENAERIENVKIFHSGTKKEGNFLFSNGGRIFGVTGYSPDNIEEARNKAYDTISKIKILGGFSYRKDIALNVIY